MRDLNCPLRSYPVRREEVRLVRRYSRVDGEFVHELTMPLGTFCLEIPEGEKYGYYVGVARLWHSVLEQLASEYVAQYRAALGKHEKLLRHAAANQPELVGRS